MLHQQSRLEEARTLYQQTLRFEPRHFHALHLLGVIALQRNQAELAVELIGTALGIEPSNVAACVNYGSAQHELGRFDEAIACYEKAVSLKPDCAEAFHNRGNALRALKRHAAAVDSYDKALELKPDYVDAYLNRGLALADLNRHEAAIASYERAMAVQPNYADPYYNRGNELRTLGRYEAAIASYDRAVALQPGFADAHLNRGSALVELRRYAAALASYDKAIALRADYAEAHFNRAGALQHLGQYAAAVAGYDTAIALNPSRAQAYANRGRAQRELKRHEAAIESYDKAISLESDSALYGVRRHLKMQICDWRGLDADVATITSAIVSGTAAPNPFYVLTLSDSAALQKRAAELWVREECPPSDSLPALPKRGRRDRLHIGYFSADFHDHATSYLIAQLFELHDRSRFRVTAFSFGPDSQGAMRKRLKAGCDEFIELRDKSDAEVALLARQRPLDIAIDLKGFTQDHRAGIFARRAAPVQVNYLGSPGTMGAPYMDYLIADRALVPATHEAHYTEKIIYLPHCYQVNDAKRVIAEKSFTRAELRLPQTGFVFCCFNNSYKILPDTFDRWMRILSRVPGSVLWLLGDNPAAIRNLRREAAARLVDPQRLVFADRIDLPEHLARHRAADLFIDTVPCNAHTTASDALWAGLPVLTCRGEGFAGRVAASLLTAIGLPQLITSTLDQYEELAVRLAGDPDELAEIRQTLAANRLTAPLFDTPLYTRHIEAAFAKIYARYQADLMPEHVFVEELSHA
jgi:predicted O-linked N-acetylglucosamine transferase (SPINDLY family)